MCRGIVTAITQLMFLILNVGFPSRTYWQPFHQLITKMYVNSILASLNARRSVLGKGAPERSFRGDSKSSGGGTDSTRTMPLAFIRKNNATVTFDGADPERSYQGPHMDHDEESNHENKAEILPHAMAA